MSPHVQPISPSQHRRATDGEDQARSNEARHYSIIPYAEAQRLGLDPYQIHLRERHTEQNQNDEAYPTLEGARSFEVSPESAENKEPTVTTSKLDTLPTEVLIRIIEFVFPEMDSAPGTAAISRPRMFIGSTTRPPLFSRHFPRDRRTAVNLLLTNKRVNNDMKLWLWSRRRFDFITVEESLKLLFRIGEENFKLITRVEIVNWGTQPNSGINNWLLREVVRHLEGVQSLGLLFFEKGRRSQDQRRLRVQWSILQLAFMHKVLAESPRLTRVYYREDNQQLRFCSEETRKLLEETEVEVVRKRGVLDQR